MIEQVEHKKRLIRWWFNVGSSAIVLSFGGALLVLRYGFGWTALQERFWLLAGLVLGYGALRLAFHLWRRGHLFDDLDEDDSQR